MALGDGNVITVIHLANNSPVWALSSHVWDSSIIWNKTLSTHQGKPFKTSSWQSIHSTPLGDAEKPKILLRLIALVLIVNVIKTTVRRPGRRRKYVYWKGNKFAKPLPEVSFQIEYTFWKCYDSQHTQVLKVLNITTTRTGGFLTLLLAFNRLSSWVIDGNWLT